MLYAHISTREEPQRLQSLQEHSRNTAEYACAALREAELPTAAYLCGMLHDMGKASPAFQKYLWDATHGKTVVRGSVNHTFAASRFLLEHCHSGDNGRGYGPLTAELLAYATGAHHGLFDCVDQHHHSGFQHRMEKPDTGYEQARPAFVAACVEPEEIDRLFGAAAEEIGAFCERLLSQLETEPSFDEIDFYTGLLARLLLSGVIEGDRRDSAEFTLGRRLPVPHSSDERQTLWKTLLTRVNEQLAGLPTDTPLQAARQTISKQCQEAAMRPGGVYRLNVPTGAGKTLSSLRFALAHAARWNKARIIFTAPLLAILEQNAAVLRQYIQDDSLILEHHSNVVRSKESGDELDLTELLVDTWDAPIIITTLVQLLNTLFDGSGSCIRRFHSLCGSVIVIDEVQTVPTHLLSLFHMAVNFLAAGCGAAVVLCSATQPCSEAAVHPITAAQREMVPYDRQLWQVFQRTRIVDAGSAALEEIPALVEKTLENADSVLIVCNKRSESASLYHMLSPTYRKFHLSAAMCQAHRREVLRELRAALADKRGQKVVCVSTQVIEAGVDISFSRVIRFAAGMDSIVQSAGRCNRNGESEEPCDVQVVRCTGEDLTHLPDIQRGKYAAMALMREFQQQPERFQGDLTSDLSVRRYYELLYQDMAKLQDGVLRAERTTLFSLLSSNIDLIEPDVDMAYEGYILRQAFQTAGKCFSVFDNSGVDVLVPFQQGRDLIVELGKLQLPYDLDKMRHLIEQAKPYTVSVYDQQERVFTKKQLLVPLCGGSVLALQEGYYDDDTGFQSQQQTLTFQEV